ncbi:MAG: 50S ribosomal protein L11 methyltransferase [Pseudomonadota bacterium]
MSLSEDQAILDTLEASREKLTPGRLQQAAAARTGLAGPALKAALRRLVDQGVLVYAQQFGSTVVEISFARPVRISDHFTLTPPDPAGPAPDVSSAHQNLFEINQACTTTLIIEPGISFGSGSHPTTRLCLRAIDHLVFSTRYLHALQPLKAVDIGTGSGVLAIAALKPLAGSCLALDTDPNCVAEAQRNVARNGLSTRISVLQTTFQPDTTAPELSLVLANLRSPTLKTLAPLIRETTLPGALMVLSGIRTTETPELLTTYENKGFKLLWQQDEKDWTGLILRKILH